MTTSDLKRHEARAASLRQLSSATYLATRLTWDLGPTFRILAHFAALRQPPAQLSRHTHTHRRWYRLRSSQLVDNVTSWTCLHHLPLVKRVSSYHYDLCWVRSHLRITYINLHSLTEIIKTSLRIYFTSPLTGGDYVSALSVPCSVYHVPNTFFSVR